MYPPVGTSIYFVKYLDLMCRLLTTYYLEPAGKLTYILLYICFFTLKPSPEFLKVIDSSFNSIGGVFVASWFPMIFPLVVLHTLPMISFHSWLCMVGGSVWIWMKSNLFQFLNEGQTYLRTFLACQTWVWPLMNQYRMLFVQTSTPLPPSMHRKLPEHWRCCTHHPATDQKLCWVRG